MTTERTDEALIEAARQGDTEAFCALYARYEAMVARRLSHLRPPTAAVDDLVQETFLRAFRALGAFRGECPFRFWLLRIATHAAHAERRRARRSPWRLFTAAAEEEALAPAAGAEAERYPERAAVHAALDRLPARLREAVILFELEGRSLAEMSAELGLPVPTVAARVRRGRAALRRRLERMGWAAAARAALGAWTAPWPHAAAAALLCGLAWLGAIAPTRPPARLLASIDPAIADPPRSPVLRQVPALPRPRLERRRTPPPPTGEVIEPEGDVIFARVPAALPPLFDARAYKARGVLVHD